jgi:hypothetical protein
MSESKSEVKIELTTKSYTDAVAIEIVLSGDEAWRDLTAQSIREFVHSLATVTAEANSR